MASLGGGEANEERWLCLVKNVIFNQDYRTFLKPFFLTVDHVYEAVFNAPWVVSINLPQCILAGFPIYPENLVTHYADNDKTRFRWYRGLPFNEKGHAMLEVCVDSLQSATNALCNGADELEVCSSLHEGGLTPTAGLVQQIMNLVLYGKDELPGLTDNTNRKKILKVNVMIRCRPGSDFCYSDSEMETMLSDIDIFKAMGVHRFVFGCLTDSQQIDDEQCIRVLAQAFPNPVTFHRAIDVSAEPIAALEEIVQLGFDRVLTSGQRNTADDPEAVELIKTMLKWYGDRIDIMPGAGITSDNVMTFLELGCKIVHSSCKKLRPLLKCNNKLVLDNCEYVYVTDGEIVKKMKSVMSE